MLSGTTHFIINFHNARQHGEHSNPKMRGYSAKSN